jgi:hypothetical protein
LSSCPSGYYTNTINNTCLSCTTGCVSCESTATCYVCAQEYYFLPGKTACVTTCPYGLCSYAQNNSCISNLFLKCFALITCNPNRLSILLWKWRANVI